MEIFLKQGYKIKNKYEIIFPIYCGEFSNVYLCSYMGKKYIAKECFPKEITMRLENNKIFTEKNKNLFQEIKYDFYKEMKILRELKEIKEVFHPKEIIKENNTLYIIGKYFSGVTLKEFIMSERDISLDRILNIFWKIVKIIGEIHKKEIIHLDLKPSNILINKREEIKILDFSNAMNLLGENKKITKNKIVISHNYSPLEMYSKNKKIDKRSDIYSIFSILYFCLNKKDPAPAYSRYFLDELQEKRLDKFIMDGMAIKRENRYKDLEEVILALEQFEIRGKNEIVL